ncbi:hypothetical protein R1flu_011021 [Riccia fluitans]|uniref:Uncharacterized protein n=1 Tax=Riccia fluitans TaxID=41844 RepID=A0ABD1Z7P8_9MARC
MSQQWGVSPPPHQVQSMGIPAVPRFSGFNANYRPPMMPAPMRPMPAYVFPAGPVSAAAGSAPVCSGNFTPMSGSSAPVTSVPQSFLLPVPYAATSPSVDSARAESMDVEGGGEAALDGNGGAGLQRARQTLVKAYMKRIGVAPFAMLTKAEKKAENLPLDFNPSWFDMIESWYSTNPHVDPPCLADSSNTFSGLETMRNQEEEIDITELDEPRPSTRCKNSSQKRKTASKSTQVISDCIGKFSGTLLEVESRREDRENRRMQILDEVESKRIALDERRVAVEEHRIEIEDRRVSEESQRAKELVGALISVAIAITNLCALKAQQNS